MRLLARLVLLCAAVLSLASVAAAAKPESTKDKDKDKVKQTPPGQAKAKAPGQPAAVEGVGVAAQGDTSVEDAPAEPVAPTLAAQLAQVAKAPPVADASLTANGESAGAAPIRGAVRVKAPGSDEFVALPFGVAVPIGTVVDATAGLVQIATESARGVEQDAVVTGAVFRVEQPPSGGGVTDLVMEDGDFSACGEGASGAPTARAAARRPAKGGQVARGLWAAGKGRFRTKGRFGTASVRGTRWATVDRCNSTTVKVFDGVVDVLDHATGKVVAVRAGQRVVVPKPAR